MRAPISVGDAPPRVVAHARGAHLMRGRRYGAHHRALRAHGFINLLPLPGRVGAHGQIVRVRIAVDMRHGQTVGVLLRRRQRDAIVSARQVFSVDEHAGHVAVVVDDRGEIAPPTVRHADERERRQVEHREFQVVAAHEAATRIVDILILHHACQHRAAPETHGLIENAKDKTQNVMAIVTTHLVGSIGQPVLEASGLRKQEQARGLDGVARDADNTRPLALLHSRSVSIHNAGGAARIVVLDSGDKAFSAQVEPAAGLCLRNLRIQRAPLGAGLAALRAEPLLNANSPTVARARIDRQVVGVHALVTQAPRAGIHHLEIVRGRHARIAIAACDSKSLLGQLIPAFQLSVVDRPVGE